QLLRDGPPASTATVLNPSRFPPLGALPLTQPCRLGRVRTRLPAFPTKAADEVHAASTPDTAWPIHGHPPDPSRILEPNPVSMSSLSSRRVNSLSSPSSPPDASSAPFPHRSPRRSSANAACGGLKPPTAGRLRRAKTFISCTAPVKKFYLQTELLSRSWHT